MWSAPGLAASQAAERALLSPRRQYRQAEACFSAAIEHDPQKLLYYLCQARARLCPRRVEIVKEDAALSLWLDPTDGKVQILSLVRYLFPRKTVCAVLRSETGCLAQETLEKTLRSLPQNSPFWLMSPGVTAAIGACWGRFVLGVSPLVLPTPKGGCSNPECESFVCSGVQWHVSELTAEVLVLAKVGFAPFCS